MSTEAIRADTILTYALVIPELNTTTPIKGWNC